MKLVYCHYLKYFDKFIDLLEIYSLGTGILITINNPKFILRGRRNYTF